MNLLPGSHKLTTSSADADAGKGVASSVGVAGKPVRVFCAHLMTLTTGALSLYNGSATTDTLYLKIDGETGKGTTVNFEGGVLFPSGCYASGAAGVQNATIVASCESA
jgi:hypothetical protein